MYRGIQPGLRRERRVDSEENPHLLLLLVMHAHQQRNKVLDLQSFRLLRFGLLALRFLARTPRGVRRSVAHARWTVVLLLVVVLITILRQE